MKIGIVGLGIVGSACKFGFELIGHEVLVHDINIKGSAIYDLLETEVIFVCVPTPSNADGSCDTSIVESVVEELSKELYGGLVAIKSTVEPGTTMRLWSEYNVNLCMVPEFLRERCAITDFTEHHDVCIIGAYDESWADVIKEAHGDLPKKYVVMHPSEAEFVKYFNNTYNAALITFANAFRHICDKVGVNYSTIVSAVSQRNHISKNYLQSNPNIEGFGGVCLPKDTRAMAALEKGTRITFFSDLLKQNDKFKTTVLPGMRDE